MRDYILPLDVTSFRESLVSKLVVLVWSAGGQEMSSLRAEIGGFLGGISAISHILNLEPPICLEKRIPLVPVYLDNSALISRIEQ